MDVCVVQREMVKGDSGVSSQKVGFNVLLPSG